MNAQLVSGFVSVASAVAAIAINALWQDALLVFGVWCLLRSWPKLNAATRYIVWSATLVAAVVVPVATTLPFIAAAPSPVSTTAGVAGGPRTPILSVQAAARHAEPSVVRGAGGGVASETLPRVSMPRFPERFRLTLPLPLALAVFGAWAILAALALVRLAVGIVKLEQLKRDALPLPVEYRDAMLRWTNASKGSREVRLCVSDVVDVPVAIGLFDAMILIPRVLLDQLSETEVDQISLHELAHLRRADDWSNGLQRLIVALLAWNPAAAFAAQQLDLEREVACDDWVLGMTGAVRPYALCLTKMAETSSWPRAPIAAPGVFATRKHISLRIERLLGAGRNIATGMSLAPTAAAIAVVATLAAAIAFVAPSIAAPVTSVTQTVVSNAVPPAPAWTEQPHKTVVLERQHIERGAVAAATAPPAPPAPPKPAPEQSNIHIPGTHVHVPAQTIHVPATDVNTSDINISVPAFDQAAVMAKAKHGLDQAKAAGKLSAQAQAAAENGVATGLSIAQAVSGAAASAAQSSARKALSGTQIAAIESGDVHQCNGCSFAGTDLSGKDMHGGNFADSDFSHAKLRNTNFSGGNFNGVDFSGADLRGASFRDANLNGTDFTHADLTGVDFTGARMTGADFSGTTLPGAQLRSVMGTCSGCDFSHSILSGADLSHVKVQGIDLSGADLRNANLSGSTFTGVDFSHSRLDGADLSGATLNGCDLGGVDLTHVDLRQAHLVGIDLSGRSH